MHISALAIAGSLLLASGGTAIAAPVQANFEKRIIGKSGEGRDIEAFHLGSKGGIVVLVIGVIHGDEDAGLGIIDALRSAEIPTGVDLWLVPSMNPDGVANDTRKNANGVDLNRNFPYRWGKIGKPSYWQYAGTSRASEPETQAMVKFIREIKPDLGIWYHQDLNIISPGTGIEGKLRIRYSQLSGIPLKRITGGTYTGVAATWQRSTIANAYAFVVELGPTLSSAQVTLNAKAALDVAVLLGTLKEK